MKSENESEYRKGRFKGVKKNKYNRFDTQKLLFDNLENTIMNAIKNLTSFTDKK